MKCKNPYCKGTQFVGVVEMDKNNLVGIKCMSCGARYSMEEIEILKSLKRKGWNSVFWRTGEKQEKTKAIILDNNELSLSKYQEEFGDLK